MKRRNFIASLLAAPVAGKLPEPKRCGMCKKLGHEASFGRVRYKQTEEWDYIDLIGTREMITSWCPNFPVDWTLFERV